MEKEKNVTEKEVKAIGTAEVKEVLATENAEVVETKEVKAVVELFLERESFVGNDGKKYWSYFVRGQIRGKEKKANFSPKDRGGYEPLDIVFEVDEKAKLIIVEETMTDNITGKRTKYMTYKAQTTDENGFVYECGIKPSHDSDKSLLGMIINQLGGVK